MQRQLSIHRALVGTAHDAHADFSAQVLHLASVDTIHTGAVARIVLHTAEATPL